MYSNNLSLVAIFFFLIVVEFFPASFPCSTSFNLSQNFLGSDENHLVFDYFNVWVCALEKDFSLRCPVMIAGDSSILIRGFSLLLSLPRGFSSEYISSGVSNNIIFPTNSQDQHCRFY